MGDIVIILLSINDNLFEMPDDPDRPLLWVNRDELGRMVPSLQMRDLLIVVSSCVAYRYANPKRITDEMLKCIE